MADGAADTQLVTIPRSDALTVFTTPEAIDPILARIRQEIDAFEGDVSTIAKQVVTLIAAGSIPAVTINY